MTNIEEVLDTLKEWHEDKMIMEDLSAFDRGRLVGHIQVIEEIERLLEDNRDANNRHNNS